MNEDWDCPPGTDPELNDLAREFTDRSMLICYCRIAERLKEHCEELGLDPRRFMMKVRVRIWKNGQARDPMEMMGLPQIVVSWGEDEEKEQEMDAMKSTEPCQLKEHCEKMSPTAKDMDELSKAVTHLVDVTNAVSTRLGYVKQQNQVSTCLNPSEEDPMSPEDEIMSPLRKEIQRISKKVDLVIRVLNETMGQVEV